MIVAYVYLADIYCPDCITTVLPTGEGQKFDGWGMAYPVRETAEENLNEIAFAFGIDRDDEYSFDSDEFPKRVYDDQLDGPETCNECGGEIR